jgi:hypothetical protein
MAAVLKLDASRALAFGSSRSGTSEGIMLTTIGLATETGGTLSGH